MATKSRPARRSHRERTDESARKLLAAAIELFAEKGFERTTVAEIGARAGYSHAMVNVRYGSKDALAQAVFRDWQSALTAEPDPDLTALQRLLFQIDQIIGVVDRTPDLYRAVSVISLELAAHPSTLRPWYSSWLDHYARFMAENLARGERDGSIRSGLDHHSEIAQFVTRGIAQSFLWSLDSEHYDIRRALHEWRDELHQRYTPTTATP